MRSVLCWMMASLVSGLMVAELCAEEAASPSTPAEAKHIANLRQVTLGLPRAGEGYFSPDGQWIV